MSLPAIAASLAAASTELQSLSQRLDTPHSMLERIEPLHDIAKAQGWEDVAYYLDFAMQECVNQIGRDEMQKLHEFWPTATGFGALK